MVVVEEDGIICADESIIFWKNALCPTDMLNIDCPVGMLLLLLNTGTSLCTVTGATATCCMEEEELFMTPMLDMTRFVTLLKTGTSLCTVAGATATCCMEEEEELLLKGIATPMLDVARFVTLDMGNVEAGPVYIRNNSCMCSFCMCFVISV